MCCKIQQCVVLMSCLTLQFCAKEDKGAENASSAVSVLDESIPDELAALYEECKKQHGDDVVMLPGAKTIEDCITKDEHHYLSCRERYGDDTFVIPGANDFGEACQQASECDEINETFSKSHTKFSDTVCSPFVSCEWNEGFVKGKAGFVGSCQPCVQGTLGQPESVSFRDKDGKEVKTHQNRCSLQAFIDDQVNKKNPDQELTITLAPGQYSPIVLHQNQSIKLKCEEPKTCTIKNHKGTASILAPSLLGERLYLHETLCPSLRQERDCTETECPLCTALVTVLGDNQSVIEGFRLEADHIADALLRVSEKASPMLFNLHISGYDSQYSAAVIFKGDSQPILLHSNITNNTSSALSVLGNTNAIVINTEMTKNQNSTVFLDVVEIGTTNRLVFANVKISNNSGGIEIDTSTGKTFMHYVTIADNTHDDAIICSRSDTDFRLHIHLSVVNKDFFYTQGCNGIVTVRESSLLDISEESEKKTKQDENKNRDYFPLSEKECRRIQEYNDDIIVWENENCQLLRANTQADIKGFRDF